MAKKLLLCWSGGKDSALALYELQNAGNYNIVALLTTLTEGYDRISMHGVRVHLLEQQAKSLALPLPLEKMYISKKASNEEYEMKMKEMLMKYQKEGISYVAFGDIFLEDVRKYREEKLSAVGMKGIFPLWKGDSFALVKKFLQLGFKAVVTCVDLKVLSENYVGRIIDERFLKELPSEVDPSGENGEFHSFVFEGPLFTKPIQFSVGEVVTRDSFVFCDLVPKL